MIKADFELGVMKFSKESDNIEGEYYREISYTALLTFLKSELSEDSLLKYHSEIGKPHLWAGSYRTVAVFIGGEQAPPPASVPYLMDNFWEKVETLSAWEAHNIFEDIHPFNDYNGRSGRAIWLHKMINEEKWGFQLSFLHMYYYQSIKNYKDKKNS